MSRSVSRIARFFWSTPQGLLSIVIGLGVVCAAVLTRPASTAAQGGSCSPSFNIVVTFDNGANWNLCWEERTKEGIVFRFVTYTPPGETARQILFRANLAEVHVPYDLGTPRFFELSGAGLGGTHLYDLAPDDCPNGTLISNGVKDVLCQTIEDRGYAYKDYALVAHGQEMSLHSVSTEGAYNYVIGWSFTDDGTIEPWLGFTGQLAVYTFDPSYGWPLGVGNTNYAANHFHNIWWRLDFDLGTAAGDVAEEIEFTSPDGDASKRVIGVTAYTVETARQHSPETYRAWRVKDPTITNADGHPISYEIGTEANHIFRGPATEPWTEYDFYVTQSRNCERYAAHNPPGGVNCADNVLAFVNGETVSDPVVWYGATFHHLPRDEDEDVMPVHHHGFHIVPRDWTAVNPFP
ncbi:MAG: copper amine oxidase [Chloroflexota bacterium]